MFEMQLIWKKVGKVSKYSCINNQKSKKSEKNFMTNLEKIKMVWNWKNYKNFLKNSEKFQFFIEKMQKMFQKSFHIIWKVREIIQMKLKRMDFYWSLISCHKN